MPLVPPPGSGAPRRRRSAAYLRPPLRHDFHPRDIPGLSAWYTAADLASVGEANPVDVWPDRSGLGNDAAQDDASLRPTWSATAANGKPGVVWDGQTRYLSTTAPVPAATAFLILKHADGPIFQTFRRILDEGPDGGNAFGTGGFSLFGLGGDTHYNPAAIVRNIFPGDLRVNGIVTTDGNPITDLKMLTARVRTQAGNLVDPCPLTLGITLVAQAQVFLGTLAEVLIYGTVLTDLDRESVESYLAATYGL